MSRRSQPNGFTLIEIIMVLAIGGAIMALVFLALTQATRGKRNAARKNAAFLYLNAAKRYVADHDGRLPDLTTFDTCSAGIKNQYITGDTSCGGGPANPFNTPEGNPWVPVYGVGDATSADEIRVSSQAKCVGGTIVADANRRQIAVAVLLEDGGTGQSYCVSG